MNAKFGKIDFGLFAATLLLLGLGVVLVYSSSFALAHQRFGGADFFLSRQAYRALLALLCFIFFINIDYHIWGKLSNLLYLIAIGLLIYVLFLPESHAINGARRWITIGNVRFQVSDIARVVMIMYLARKCEESGPEIKKGKVFFLHLSKICIMASLIVLEPDFSSAIILTFIGLSILFVSGARVSHIFLMIVSIVPVSFALVFNTPYRRNRMLGFLNMPDRVEDLGYQTFQSLVGLGNGGLLGVGLGRGEQKYFYLPEPHTDFAFSILGEEIGFIGLVIVLCIFVFMIYRGLKISLNARDKLGQVMAFGFTITVTIYLLVHTCVSTGLIPTTGVPMPFLSYGGMSLIFTMSTMGILLNISSQTRDEIAVKELSGIIGAPKKKKKKR
ncbi:putative lipid II flippase FtsW [Chitinispirillales bacterium ANBcel5]|uniref:putative lipid II flippase FtsW n=1 Tax=Cellulosispirillum alkaliphilum TaxID=3039283 RepID=UPI002A542423|nr:putative lipid II flippase FtsW [Chitinispirillales bacterium ANBcel5]